MNDWFRGKRMIDRVDIIRFIQSIIILLATVELKSLLFLIRQLTALKISINLATKIGYKS